MCVSLCALVFFFFFFFNDTATTEIYTLSLHDALPIFSAASPKASGKLWTMTSSASCSGMRRRSCWRAFSPCAATIRLRRAFASLFIMASRARPQENAASCGSMTSPKIRVISAVRPAWRRVPNSSCRFSYKTASSVFSIWRARNLMRSPWNTNACYPLSAPMWPSHSRMHGSMKKPARVGGDFYDFLPYGQGRLGFMLGDVSGKGTAAALYGSLAIGTVREIVVDHACEPACMLALLNQRLLGARLDSRFIAMLFAVYDASTRKLTLANAGGPYPLLVRNGQVRAIHLEGVPLGLIPDTQYDETTIDLEPGDVVLFASDGILESENTVQEEFGPERLRALLSAISRRDSARDISERILAATDGHSGAGTAPHDDRTLVVLRVTDDTSSDFSKLPIIY